MTSVSTRIRKIITAKKKRNILPLWKKVPSITSLKMAPYINFRSRSFTRAQNLIASTQFYRATISDPHRFVFRCNVSDIAFGDFSATLDGTVVNDMWEPEDKLFISCCFLTLLNWNTIELKYLPIVRTLPELLLWEAPKFITRLWL